MSSLQITYLVILALCILGSGFFSGSETALIAIPRERVHQLARRDHRGRYLSDLSADPDQMLSTLLVANNFVNILGAAVATALAIELLGERWGPWAATLVITSIILVLGEITPKTLAARYPDRFALVVAPAIWFLSRAIRPISRVFLTAGRLLLRGLGVGGEAGPAITEDDIRAMAALGEMEGGIEAAEREIIEALFTVADRPVRDIMTPRVDIVALEAPVTLPAVRAAVASSGHSRYPVIEGDLDHLQGILYVKDLLGMEEEPGPERIMRLLRDPYYVPESKPVLELLQEMRTRKLGFAVVLDEHGGVEGVCTAKDVVAEVVGELQDEYDPGAPSLSLAAPGVWLADGRLGVEELEEAIDLELPRGPYTTVGGLFLERAGHIPERGESIELERVRFTVVRMDRNRIDRLRVEFLS